MGLASYGAIGMPEIASSMCGFTLMYKPRLFAA